MTMSVVFIVFFKQKTAYEMRISDWSSDVCSSDPFIELSGRRQKIATTLADHIRALGDLPSEPDADREALGNVVRHVKSMLSDAEWRGLIAEREAGERAPSGSAAAAQRAPFPDRAEGRPLGTGWVRKV